MAGESGSGKKAADQSETCHNFPEAAKRTVVLAVKLTGATVKDSHAILSRVLADHELQEKLHAALKKAGEELMAEQAKGNKVTLGKSLGTIGSATGSVLKSPVLKEVKKSSEYWRLEQGLQDFKCAFDNTPVGVFYNENKTLLIIVGVVGAVGAGAAMYYTKAGDLPAKAFSLLPSLTPIKLGTVELKVSDFKFKPSERQFDATVGAAVEWKAVKASFEVSVAFKNDKLVGAGGKTDLAVSLNARTTAFANASGSWAEGADGKPDAIKGRANLGVKRSVSQRVNLQFQLYGEFDQNDKKRTSQVGFGVSSKVAQPLGPKSSLSVGASVGTGTYQYQNGPGYTQSQPDHRVNFGLTLRFP